MATNKAKSKVLLTVGKKLFIRTVTHYYTGKVISFDKDEIILDQAAWVADTSRWSIALEKGTLSEVEPYPDGPVAIARGAIVDYCEWKHDLPRQTK